MDHNQPFNILSCNDLTACEEDPHMQQVSAIVWKLDRIFLMHFKRLNIPLIGMHEPSLSTLSDIEHTMTMILFQLEKQMPYI